MAVSRIFPLTINGKTAESAPLQYSQISPASSFIITDILFRSVRNMHITSVILILLSNATKVIEIVECYGLKERKKKEKRKFAQY